MFKTGIELRERLLLVCGGKEIQKFACEQMTVNFLTFEWGDMYKYLM